MIFKMFHKFKTPSTLKCFFLPQSSLSFLNPVKSKSQAVFCTHTLC